MTRYRITFDYQPAGQKFPRRVSELHGGRLKLFPTLEAAQEHAAEMRAAGRRNVQIESVEK